jgi:hypothetical protein
MQEKENVLRILEETKLALKNNDAFKLKDLSNQTVHTASMSQDSENIAVAVLVYSLSKIIERTEYKDLQGWDSFYKTILSSVDNSINAIKTKNDKKLTESLTLLRNAISKLSGKLKFYIQDVFRKAEINKASKIYEHGISMEKTANLLGITMFELASYAGQKQEMGVPLGQTLDVKSRIKIAEDIFK